MSFLDDPRTGPELVAERKELLDLIAFQPIDSKVIRGLLPLLRWSLAQEKAAQEPRPRRGRPPKAAASSRNPWAEIDHLNL